MKTVHLADELHSQLRIKAIHLNMTIKQITDEAVSKYLLTPISPKA